MTLIHGIFPYFSVTCGHSPADSALFKMPKVLFDLLANIGDAWFSRFMCRDSPENGTNPAAGFLKRGEKDAAAAVMIDHGSTNTHGNEVYPVFGKSRSSPGGKDVMVAPRVHYEISGVQGFAQVVENPVKVGAASHEHQDDPWLAEESGELFDSGGGGYGQALSFFQKFPDSCRIRIVAGNGVSEAGYGQNQVPAEEPKTDDADIGTGFIVTIMRHESASDPESQFAPVGTTEPFDVAKFLCIPISTRSITWVSSKINLMHGDNAASTAAPVPAPPAA
jgi:hypothetical protein